MRAVGATRSDILGSMLTEGALLGAAGSALGLLLAFLLSIAGNLVAARYLPDFPFKPDDFFRFLFEINDVFALRANVGRIQHPRTRIHKQRTTYHSGDGR